MPEKGPHRAWLIFEEMSICLNVCVKEIMLGRVACSPIIFILIYTSNFFLFSNIEKQ